jgi:hypothetical protein
MAGVRTAQCAAPTRTANPPHVPSSKSLCRQFKERLYRRLDTVPEWLGLEAASADDLAAEIEITIDDMDDLLRRSRSQVERDDACSGVRSRGRPESRSAGHGTVQFFARQRPPNQNEARARAGVRLARSYNDASRTFLIPTSPRSNRQRILARREKPWPLALDGLPLHVRQR